MSWRVIANLSTARAGGLIVRVLNRLVVVVARNHNRLNAVSFLPSDGVGLDLTVDARQSESTVLLEQVLVVDLWLLHQDFSSLIGDTNLTWNTI